MSCVGAVYTVDPFVRTADEIVDEVMRDRRKEDRPKPRHKQMRAEMTRDVDGQQFNAKEQIFSWFAEGVTRRAHPRNLP